jgi:hypothetical protein
LSATNAFDFHTHFASSIEQGLARWHVSLSTGGLKDDEVFFFRISHFYRCFLQKQSPPEVGLYKVLSSLELL